MERKILIALAAVGNIAALMGLNHKITVTRKAVEVMTDKTEEVLEGLQQQIVDTMFEDIVENYDE